MKLLSFFGRLVSIIGEIVLLVVAFIVGGSHVIDGIARTPFSGEMVISLVAMILLWLTSFVLQSRTVLLKKMMFIDWFFLELVYFCISSTTVVLLYQFVSTVIPMQSTYLSGIFSEYLFETSRVILAIPGIVLILLGAVLILLACILPIAWMFWKPKTNPYAIVSIALLLTLALGYVLAFHQGTVGDWSKILEQPLVRFMATYEEFIAWLLLGSPLIYYFRALWQKTTLLRFLERARR
jgi:hypothetical protein